MENRKRTKDVTTIIFLSVGLLAAVLVLAFMVTAFAEEAKPASVLLQEGIYAEEIEGNLDAAIKIYEQVIAQAKAAEQTAAQATYRLGMCYLKKGENEKAAEQFQKVSSKFPEQKAIVEKANQQLEKILPQQNLFTQSPPEVLRSIGNRYGAISAEAGSKSLYSNSHIYFVTSDFVLMSGGMGYYQNMSSQALTGKMRLGGTSRPKQTHFDIAGRQMNTEIIADRVRPDFYHIYWTPHEPIAPGQFFYYGWSIDDAKKLKSEAGSSQHALTMQNKFGNRVVETFFLVVPSNTSVASQSENYTGRETISGFDIYYWSKEVPPNTNNIVNVILAPATASFKAVLFDNSALDLETGAVAALGDRRASVGAAAGATVGAVVAGAATPAEWPQGFDVTWDNDEGGALMVGPGSGAKIVGLSGVEKGNWAEAVSKAQNALSVLRTSTGRGIVAKQSSFVAVLTGEGNLAVIEIGSYGPDKAELSWRLEKLGGPEVLKVFLPDADTPNAKFVLDLGSGELLAAAGQGEEQLAIFRQLGRGDLVYDQALMCIRGGKVKGLKVGELQIGHQIEDCTGYILPPVPCELLVTTAEGNSYKVTIVSKSESGINLEYSRIGRAEVEKNGSAESRPGGFGPVMKEVIAEDTDLIDFDTGKMFKVPEIIRKGSDTQTGVHWARDNGIDASVDSALIAIEMGVQKLQPKAWEQITAGELRAIAIAADARMWKGGRPMRHIGIYPATYAFKTRENGMGILQILDVNAEGATVQYKMLAKDFVPKSAVDINSLADWKIGPLPKSANRKLVDETTLKAVEDMELPLEFLGLYGVEELYEAASQSEKEAMIRQWRHKLQYSSDSEEQEKAAAALGNVAPKDKEVLKLLLDVVSRATYHDGDRERPRSPMVQFSAVRALGRIGDISAVPTLITCLDDQRGEMRNVAKVALAEITGVYFGDDKPAWQKWWDETGSKRDEKKSVKE